MEMTRGRDRERNRNRRESREREREREKLQSERIERERVYTMWRSAPLRKDGSVHLLVIV